MRQAPGEKNRRRRTVSNIGKMTTKFGMKMKITQFDDSTTQIKKNRKRESMTFPIPMSKKHGESMWSLSEIIILLLRSCKRSFSQLMRTIRPWM